MTHPPTAPDSTVRMGKGMFYAAWVLALALLTFGFHQWLEGQKTPSAKSARVEDRLEVALTRNRYGHYQTRGHINGQEVEFIVDTGATEVSIPGGVARRLGLQRGAPMAVMTAGGAITVYATGLKSVRLGDIELHGIKAHINPTVNGEEVLLGMSFLKHTEFAQRGNTLTLRQVASQ